MTTGGPRWKKGKNPSPGAAPLPRNPVRKFLGDTHTRGRSRRKTPIVGHTTCRSEREDKKLWHQRWRTHERTALASASPEALCAHLPLLENQVSNVWSMGKDGRSYWPIKRQAATADRIANHKGRNPQERASLKKRLLRKWMSK